MEDGPQVPALAGGIISLSVLDAQDRMVYLRSAITEYTEEELRGLSPESVVHPDDFLPYREMLARARAGAGGEPLVVRLRRRDGVLRTAEMMAFTLPDQVPAGGVVVVGRDLSGRLAAEAAIRESEARFRQLAQHIDEVFWLVELRPGEHNRLLYVSPAVQSVWGLSPETFLANPRAWLELVVPSDRERVLAEMERAQREGNVALEYAVEIPGRGRRILATRFFPVPGPEGRTYRIAGLTDDVTEARRAQREVEENEARFRLLVEEAGDVFALVGADGTIRYESPSVESLLGYRAEETVGTPLWNYMDPDEVAAARAVLGGAFRGGPRQGMAELRFRHRDGSWRTVEFFYRLLADPAGEPLLVVNARDTTERRQLEEQFRQAQRMEAVGRLAGGVAHDFNNLLTAILGYAELALDELAAGTPVAEDVTEIRRAAERARGVTRQLLAFSRRQVLQPRVVEAAGLLRGMERMLRLLLRQDVRLDVRVAEGPSLMRVDPGQIEQVLMNLAVNAGDATGPGGTVWIEVDRADAVPLRAGVPAYVRPGSYVRLVVADDGSGMPPEVLGSVFEPFFTTKEPGKGTGLGLSTVYGIVNQSGGYVWAESAVGRGSTFTVLLPAAQEEESAAGPADDRAPVRLAGATAAVVEDEEAVRNFVAAVLRKHGMHVLAFAGPSEALSVLQVASVPVDVLVTDVVLPEMCGPALAERVRAVRPALPVLFMSGYTEDAADFADLLRTSRVLEKPFGGDDLLRQVAQALSADPAG
ncbi:MAG TPA: PAS domain S-box protein [Longimicrobium sp.]